MSSLLSAYTPHQIALLGDSVSDSGNSVPVLGFADVPPASYPFPRFCPLTDGVTWPVLLAQELHTEKRFLPYVQGGTNFAYLGAQTVTIPSFPPAPNPSLTEQLALIPASLGKKTPFFVFGGANDIFAYDAMTYPNPGITAGQNLGAILRSLNSMGFEYLFSLNMPNIGALPSVLGTASAPIYTEQTGLLNAELQDQLSYLDFPVFAVDTHTFFNQILDNFQQYGFTTVTTTPVINPYPALGGENTAGFAFWYDGTHFTNALHQLLADYVYAQIGGAECFATLAETPFTALREQTSAIRQQLFPLQPERNLGEYYFFLNSTYVPYSIPALSDACSHNKFYGGTLSSGFVSQRDDSCSVGAALEASWNRKQCRTKKTSCAYHLNVYSLSVFGNWVVPFEAKEEIAYQGGYVNAICNVAWLNFRNIKRTMSLGSFSQTSKSNTDGVNCCTLIYGAYYIPYQSPWISTGPTASLEYQFNYVCGYYERGMTYGNMVFRGQSNNSLSSGIGWEVRFKDTGFMGDLSLSINRQWLGIVRDIQFREESLPATYGVWPAEMPQVTFLSGGINVSIFCKQVAVLSVGYSFNSGLSDVPMWEQSINLNASF